MKDKIEIGEYIRTIDGYIRKIDNINTGRKITIYGEHILDIPYKNSKSVAKKKIIKHSKNIIDLIEVGDYVNKQEVVNVEGFDKNGDDKEALGIIDTDGDYAYGVFLEDIPIRTIVTKEQFKEMEYRV